MQRLLVALSQYQLLNPAQLNEVRDAQEQDCYPSPQALAEDLQKRGWLTAYQAEQLVRGQAEKLVLGQYLLLDQLGQGAMGQVFKARHQRMERLVALKVIRKNLLKDPQAVARFNREVKAAAQLSHPNIVMAFDADELDGTHFMVMEYAEGIDLHRWLKKTGRLPIAQACDFARQVALGLQHAHAKGLVHRDIKPANLLLTGEGPQPTQHSPLTTHRIKILDFGLARLGPLPSEPASPTRLTEVGEVMGTPDYMAPEQIQDSHQADIRSDLYSLGCTLYELLAGHVPFPASGVVQKIAQQLQNEPVPVEELRTEVPPELAAIVRRLMAKRPEDRFQGPAEVAEALLPFCGRAGATAASVTAELPAPRAALAPDTVPTPRLAARPSRRRLRVAPFLAALLLAGAAAGATLFLVQAGSEPEANSQSAEDLPIAIGPLPTARAPERPKAAKPTVPDEPKIEPAPSPALPPETDRVLLQIEEDRCKLKTGRFARDGKRAVFLCSDSVLRVWNLPKEPGDDQPTTSLSPPEKDSIWSMDLSVDGERVIYGGEEHVYKRGYAPPLLETLGLWRLSRGEKPLQFEVEPFIFGQPRKPTKATRQVAFGPDGTRALSGGDDGSIQLWNLKDRPDKPQPARFARKEKERDRVTCLAWSSDGRRAISGGLSGRVTIWDVTGRVALHCFHETKGSVNGVALSPDGHYALSGSQDGAVRLWELQADPPRCFTWEGHQGAVTCVAFAPDGQRAVSGGLDSTVRVRAVPSGTAIRCCEGHSQGILRVAFTPDGRHVLSAGYDNQIRQWVLLR
jgi:serine/threonine protein kinase/WD40 repeat protein